MTKKEEFIAAIEKCIITNPEFFSEGALSVWNDFKNIEIKEKPLFTKNGAKVLIWMQENKDSFNNIFKAKEVAEGLELPSSRSVSGAMRKLIADGYVDKMGSNPICYSMTEKGMTCEVIIPEEEDN